MPSKMVTQIYVDESGKGGDGPIFVLACVEANSADWEQLASEWAGVRDSDPKIEYFSMAECWAGQGEFRDVPKLVRWNKALEFAKVARRNVRRAHCFNVGHALFKKLFHGRIDRRYDDPYYFMLTDAVEEIVTRIVREDSSIRIQFIFDRQLQFEQDVQNWFQAIVPAKIREVDATYGEVLIGNPSFDDEKRVVPIQVADMIAWHERRLFAQLRFGIKSMSYFPLIEVLNSIPTLHIETD